MPARPPCYPRQIELVLPDPTAVAAISAKLCDLRDRLGVGQAEVPARTEAKYQNLLRLEGGRTERELRKPRLATLAKYVDVLGWELVLVARPKGREE